MMTMEASLLYCCCGLSFFGIGFFFLAGGGGTFLGAGFDGGRPFEEEAVEEAVETAELRSGCSVGGMEGVPAELRSGSVVRGLDGVADSLVRSREESREVTELSPVDPAGAFAGAIVE
jgi:hypothetical protein